LAFAVHFLTGGNLAEPEVIKDKLEPGVW